MKSTRLVLGGAVTLGLILTAARADITEKDLTGLIESEAKVIQEALKEAKPTKQMKNKAKAAALMAALYAQEAIKNGGNGEQLAGARDTAIKLATAVKDEKLADAKKLAEELLSMKGKGDPKATPNLKELFEIDTLMSIFRADKAGGQGLEKKIQGYAKSGKPDKESALVGLKSALAAIHTEALAPASDMGAKKKADWMKWSKDMKDAGFEAAKASKPAEVKKAFGKLDGSCIACHNVFRD